MEPSAYAYCPFGKRDYYPQILVHHDAQIQEQQVTKPSPVHRCHTCWLQSTTSSLLGPTVALFQTHTRLSVTLLLVTTFLLLLVLDGLMGSAAQVPLTEADPEHLLPDHRLAMHAGKAAIKEMHRQFVVFMDSHESL